MIIHATSFLAGPLLLVVWAIDIYLVLAGVRLIAARMSGPTAFRLSQGLQPVTDGVPTMIRQWLVKHKKGLEPPGWVPWAITVGGGIFLRYLLIWFAICFL